jgi:hypothetical protein
VRQTTRVTPDREELLTYVSGHPGMWGDDLCAALGWSEGRFWAAASCPLFDFADPRLPAGYRLTEAGCAALLKVALKHPERKPHKKGRKPKPWKEPKRKAMRIPKPKRKSKVGLVAGIMYGLLFGPVHAESGVT